MNWYATSDSALMELIGSFVKEQRLQQNKSQEELAQQAGISRSTLSLLEKGETGTVSTLIQVLRVLEQLEVLEAFEVTSQVSPLELAKLQRKKRQRASSHKNTGDREEPEW
ncbi:MAG: helix-turn-helix transcriptional regulator [Marinoscillum sp.]